MACNNDYECKNNQFCWYRDGAAVTSNSKTCMLLYSEADDGTFGWYSDGPPSLADYEQNGRFCQSGLAYAKSATEARCTTYKEMLFDGAVVEEDEGHPCDPTDQQK